MEGTAVAARFLEALGRRDFARLKGCLDPAVRFRALVPPGVREAADAAGAVGHLSEWFGGADHFEVVASAVEPLADRIGVRYRLRLRDEDGWRVVEQQAYCDVVADRIARLDLVCSGFRPEEVVAGAAPDGVVEPDALLDAPGESCATLTPLVRARMRELTSGQVLELRTDDPAAPASLAAWCRLTGNELVASRGQRFYLRKK